MRGALLVALVAAAVQGCHGDGCSMTVAPLAPLYEAVNAMTPCDTCAGGHGAFLTGKQTHPATHHLHNAGEHQSLNFDRV